VLAVGEQITQQGDLGSVMGLFVEEDPHHLPRGPRSAQVARPLDQKVAVGRGPSQG
jgi:hypothetical protein